MSYALRDALLEKTRALPNGAASTTSAALDLGHDSTGSFVAGCELEIDAPALTTGELPDGQTVTYEIVHSDNADLSAPATVGAALLVQTGAGGAGAAAATKRFRPPSDVRRYVGLKATKTGAADASGKSATLRLLF